MWGNGPYERITATITDIHDLVIDRLDPRSGVDFLDAACGTGAVAFLAAERGATVTGMDIAPPDGGLGQMFAMMRPFTPPPPEGVGSPFDWGREEHVRGLLGDAVALEFEEHDSVLRIESGEAYWDLFSSSYGPTKTALEALDPARQEEFHQTWVEFFEQRREGDQVVPTASTC